MANTIFNIKFKLGDSLSLKEKQIIYYQDELNDEFSRAKITPRKIDENYCYLHQNPLWNFCSFMLQNVLSMPIKARL